MREMLTRCDVKSRIVPVTDHLGPALLLRTSSEGNFETPFRRCDVSDRNRARWTLVARILAFTSEARKKRRRAGRVNDEVVKGEREMGQAGVNKAEIR